MFRTKLTLVALVVAAATYGLSVPRALAAHDPWYAYATSLTIAQQSGPDPWYGYAVSLTNAQHLVPFITDTLAPGGAAPVQSYRFITDTLAPGGGPSVVLAPASNGFDWGDAGIGAGGALGLMLAATGGTLLLAHRRTQSRTAS
jgi:hypothetical protein